MLPDFTAEGELPVGVHLVEWPMFQSRFGCSTPRRVWLLSRLESLVDLAASTGHLKRIFVWGSFVTAKPSPRDLDVLLIMSEDFSTEGLQPEVAVIFDSTRARLQFEADVFWAKISIGESMLQLWLDTYQMSRSFAKRGIVELELP